MKPLARYLFAFGLLGSVLALGAIHTAVLAGSAVVLTASAFFAWRGEEAFRFRPSARILVLIAVALTAATAAQAIPLPLAIVARLAPANAAVWARALEPLHLAAPAWATLSLDPVATRIEVLRGVTYLAALLAALRIAREREGVIFLERLILASAVILAFAALLHPALDADRVFGVYKPVNDIAARHVAPLLNANHLAGYVNIGICFAAGAALSPRPHLPRVAAVGAAVLLVIVEVWVGSRGGVGSMVIALVLVGILSRAARTTTGQTLPMSALIVGTVVVASLAVVVLVSSEAALSELTVLDLSKLQIFRQSMRVLASSPVVGIGRGAFASVFPAFRTGSGDFTYNQPENILAQWSVEWGAPVAIVALGACAWALRPSVLLARSRPPIGAWAALACLFVHNLVDFSSEVPGVVVTLTACAGLVVGGGAGLRRVSARSRARIVARSLSSFLRPRQLGLGLGMASALALVVALGTLGRDDDQDGVMLRALVLGAPRDKARFDAAAHDAIARHPAEPYFPYLGALRALTVGDEPALPWLEATLLRAPFVYGRAHLLLARLFFLRSPAQARLEYRLAYLQDPGQTNAAASEGARLVDDYDGARELAPVLTEAGTHVLAVVSGVIAPRLPATSARLDLDLQSAGPWADAALERRVQAALFDLEDEGSAWCVQDRAACLKLAHQLVEKLRVRAPDSCRTDAVDADLARAEGDTDRSRAILERAVRTDHDGAQCVDQLVTLASRETDPAHADALLDRIGHLACEAGDRCSATLLALASSEQARGNARRAFSFAKQAYDHDATDDVLIRVAQLASAAGLHAEALEDFRRLSLRHPDDHTWASHAEDERSAILRNTIATPAGAPSVGYR